MQKSIESGQFIVDWENREALVLSSVVNDFEETWMNIKYKDNDEVKFYIWSEGQNDGQFRIK